MDKIRFNLIEEKEMPLPRTTLWRLRNRKDNPLPYYRIGRRVYYTAEHLEALLKICEVREGVSHD